MRAVSLAEEHRQAHESGGHGGAADQDGQKHVSLSAGGGRGKGLPPSAGEAHRCVGDAVVQELGAVDLEPQRRVPLHEVGLRVEDDRALGQRERPPHEDGSRDPRLGLVPR